ncbi:hypothetical protein FD754_013122, partial [Muntiacus muntjak]
QAIRHSNLKENRGRLPHEGGTHAFAIRRVDSRVTKGVPRSLPFGDGGKFHIEFLFPVSFSPFTAPRLPTFFSILNSQQKSTMLPGPTIKKRKESDADRRGMNVRARNSVETPWFNGWGFNLPRGQSLLDKWNLIPEGIDILMTHGPPLGFRDWVPKELQRVGCVELLNTVQRRVRPKLHVFGGIHEGYGIMTDGYTTYINASTCTVSFQPTNPPIIFDLPNPQGS